MQQRKVNWKRIRNDNPCRMCGRDHQTKDCLTRKGGNRRKLEEELIERRMARKATQ
jgi:predicted NACHT family NTPase